MMRTTAATVFLVLLAVLLGSLSAIQLSQSNLDAIFGEPPLAPGDRMFDFDLEDIARLHITDGTGTTAVFHWENHHWKMKKPTEDRADYRHLQSLVLATHALRVEDVIPRHELDPEQAGFRAGRFELALTNSKGERVARYILGRRTPWHRLVGEKGELSATFYIRPADREDFVYVCSGPNARPLLESGFNTLRDHRPFLFNAKDLAQITIRDKNGEVVVTRDTREALWRITKPLELRTDLETVIRLAGNLYKLEALAVHDPGSVTIPPRATDAPYLEFALDFFDRKGAAVAGPVLTVEPPAGDEAKTVYAQVTNRNTVFELPLDPTNGQVALAQLPVSVDDLRSRTLCSFDLNSLKSATLSAPELAPPLVLSLGRESISGKPRWMISQGPVPQPANEATVARLFTAIAIDNAIGFASDAAADLKPFGLDPPAKRLVLDVGEPEPVELLFGKSAEGRYFAMRSGSTTVAEIDYGTYNRVAVTPFSWRAAILMEFALVDLAALRIERPDQPALDLTYDFITEAWTARRGREDITQRLNVQRANILVNNLVGVRATRWLGPDAREARLRLDNPSLIIEAAFRPDGNPGPPRRTVASFAPASDLPGNKLYFGRLSGDLDFFLLDKDSYDLINVDLLEE